MAIRENGVNAVNVGDLLSENLRIPHYQRPYSWEPPTALQLLDDIGDSLERNDAPYVLGAVILLETGGHLEVVDGQQRLITLRMILGLLGNQEGFAVPVNGDNPISRVGSALRRRIDTSPHDKALLLNFVRDRCQLVRIVTDDVDEAFRVFDSQNYRGKPLAPHDLLKAHHLRAMRSETAAMKAAVVESWESVKDDDLDRLFSIYLYRIAKWSRGESAPGFTTHDIGMFKGLLPQQSMTPTARYHVAAQAALPMLTAWGTAYSADFDDRDGNRSRFQLDAPLVAGRPFFEMVSFMLAELGRLRREVFPDRWNAFASSNDELEEMPALSRYRKVSELYLAAMLYYTNKFADEDLTAARERLFSWAYGLRVDLLRVQHKSIDNLGRGKDGSPSAFPLLRNASSGKVVNHLPASSTPYNEGHEADLVALLKDMGAS